MAENSFKLDEELCRRHGITKQCVVCVTRMTRFLLLRHVAQMKARHPKNWTFKVHFGRCFLEQIANHIFDLAPNIKNFNVKHLYRTHVRSRFAALTVERFGKIVIEYLAFHQRGFHMRRNKILEKKIAEHNEIQRGVRFIKGCYSFVVLAQNAKEVQKALQEIDKCCVRILRVRVDQKDVSDVASVVSNDTNKEEDPMIVSSSSGSESASHDIQDNPRAATEMLLRELINWTSESIEFYNDPDSPLQSSSAVPSLEQQDGEDDSDATEDAHMSDDAVFTDDTETSEHENYMHEMCNGNDFDQNSSARDSDSTVWIENGIHNRDSDIISDHAEECKSKEKRVNNSDMMSEESEEVKSKENGVDNPDSDMSDEVKESQLKENGFGNPESDVMSDESEESKSKENGVDNPDSDMMSDEVEESSCLVKSTVRNPNQSILLVPMNF